MKPRHSQQLARLPVVLFAAVALCSMPVVVHAQEQKPLVFTFSGPVRGSVTSAGVREFLGIPYAAPPVGNLRWRPPVPHAPRFAPLEATQFANHCPQPLSPFGIASVTEDCLFLNVFSPDSNEFFHPRAVMVWIHGGALVFGESNDVFACPALGADFSMSQFVPLSTYEFSDENAPQDFLPPVSFPYAAAHGSELQYLFALPVAVPRPPFNAQQMKLSRAMQHYWTNFAKFGNPNGPGVPVWQKFNPSVGNFQSLIPPSPVQETDFAASHHCAFWAALLSAQ